MKDILIDLVKRHNGVRVDIEKAIRDSEKLEVKQNDSLDLETITLFDDNYPIKKEFSILKPYCLFYIGDVSLLESKTRIHLVTRNHISSSDERLLKIFLDSLVESDYLLVIKLLNDSDRLILEYANFLKLNLIVVVNDQVNKYSDYLKINPNLLIVSEFLTRSTSAIANYQISTLLIMLSKKIIILSVDKNAMFTDFIDFCIEAHIEIYAYPITPLYPNINNTLIKQGAFLFEELDDLSNT